MAGFLTVGLVLFLVGVGTLVGIKKRSDKTMGAVWGVWFVLLFVQVTMAFLLCWWVYVLEDVPNETLATLQGKDDGRYEGELGAEALTNVEGFVCTLYQKCCRDPQLDLAAVIMEGSGEAGSGDGAQAAGICNPLDKVFPLRDCRDNFCLAGPEGYY